MKKLNCLIVLFLATFFCTAQETSTIKVMGRTMHVDNELTFEGSVSLSATYSSYPSEAISLEQMKSKYNEALKKNGLSIADLREDKIGHLYMNSDKEGVIYHFKTPSLDKFNRFLASKSFGVYRLVSGYSIVISENEGFVAALKAIKNAKEKAQTIAKSANKELGQIVHIEDNNLVNIKLKNQPLYYDSDVGQYIYYINVTFELTDK